MKENKMYALKLSGKAALAVASLALWAGQAQSANVIPTLFNTGVITGTTLVANSAADPHWTIGPEATAYGASAATPGVLSNPGNTPSVYWVGSDNPAGQASSWISSQPNHVDTAANTSYTYRTTFDLTGFNPNAIQIGGVWASDNQLQGIRLNGTTTITGDALNAVYNAVTAQRTTLHTFSLAAFNGLYTAGINTLEFILTNADLAIQTGSTNPTGLRVEFNSARVVDEPASLGLLGLGVLALSAMRRRKA